MRLVELEKEITLNEFVNLVKRKFNIKHLRVVNNFNQGKIKKIALCAGSGADFLPEVERLGADVFVTGDVKYHTALESNVIMVDIGHFESEILILEKIKEKLRNQGIEVEIADEKSPFINY